MIVSFLYAFEYLQTYLSGTVFIFDMINTNEFEMIFTSEDHIGDYQIGNDLTSIEFYFLLFIVFLSYSLYGLKVYKYRPEGRDFVGHNIYLPIDPPYYAISIFGL